MPLIEQIGDNPYGLRPERVSKEEIRQNLTNSVRDYFKKNYESVDYATGQDYSVFTPISPKEEVTFEVPAKITVQIVNSRPERFTIEFTTEFVTTKLHGLITQFDQSLPEQNKQALIRSRLNGAPKPLPQTTEPTLRRKIIRPKKK